MSLSVDLRKRVIAAIDEGMHQVDAAKFFKVSRRAICDWINLRKKTDSLAPKFGYQKGHSHSITDWDQFKKFAEINKYCTINQMVAEWKKLTDLTISRSVIQRALKKIGYTFKKKPLVISKPKQQNVNFIWKKSKI